MLVYWYTRMLVIYEDRRVQFGQEEGYSEVAGDWKMLRFGGLGRKHGSQIMGCSDQRPSAIIIPSAPFSTYCETWEYNLSTWNFNFLICKKEKNGPTSQVYYMFKCIYM